MNFAKKSVATFSAVALLSVAGVAAANNKIKIEGSGGGKAKLECPGGMDRLGHPFNEQMSIFPGDPAITVDDVYTVLDDFFKVEAIRMGPHAGTHLDAPEHFIAEGRSVDELAAEEFVWPAYKIDVRGLNEYFAEEAADLMTVDDDGNPIPLVGADGNPIPFVGIDFIKAYEKEYGKIQKGSLVILQTGAEEFFGLDDAGDMRETYDEDGFLLADNDDDLFGYGDDDEVPGFNNAGFSFDAVQWLFDERGIDAIGADAYGPDAYNDPLYDATYATLLNDGVALVALANLDTVSIRGDIIMAPAVALTDGSGFSVDPLACHAKKLDG